MNVACLLLAAGLSRRLGRAKQLLPWQGTTLVHYTAQTALAAQPDTVVAVLGHRADDVRAQLADIPVTCVFNPAYADGQGSSVACGAHWLMTHAACDAIVVLLCDQPFLSASHITQCVSAWQRTRPDVLVPRVNGQRTHPVVWSAHTLPLLAQLTGESAGRTLIAAGRVVPQYEDLTDPNLLIDIDTMDDYHAAQRIPQG